MENNERRDFLKSSIKISLGVAALSTLNTIPSFAKDIAEMDRQGFVFSQVKLPYSYAALEPHIDALTMEIHYTKHHAAYVKNVNEAIQSEHLNFKDAHDFFSKASTLSAKARNNGGGAWNHNFFWESMKSGGPAEPSGKLKTAIEKSFKSVAQFKEQFAQAALSRFGSGWAWLIHKNGVLSISSTANQDNPLMDQVEEKGTPLLALDVWEHAYYLKYQNKRNDYINSWWNLVDWDTVGKRLG